jgi:hypothetical protein
VLEFRRGIAGVLMSNKVRWLMFSKNENSQNLNKAVMSISKGGSIWKLEIWPSNLRLESDLPDQLQKVDTSMMG